MHDRSAELRRQRALVAEHLAWLDREIADSSRGPSRSETATTPQEEPQTTPAHATPAVANPYPDIGATCPDRPTPPSPPAGPVNLETGSVAPQPEPLLPELNPVSIRQDVRRGCLLYLVVGSAILAGLLALLAWAGQAYSRSHPAPPRSTGTVSLGKDAFFTRTGKS